MKRIFMLLAMLIAFHFSYAQWSGTNPVTTNSNVGIGVTGPAAKLHVLTSGQSALTLSGNTTGYQGPDLYITRVNSSATVGLSPGIQFTDIATGMPALYSLIMVKHNSLIMQAAQAGMRACTFWAMGMSA